MEEFKQKDKMLLSGEFKNIDIQNINSGEIQNTVNHTTLGTVYDQSTHDHRNSRFTFIKLPNEENNGDEKGVKKSNSAGHLNGPVFGASSIRQHDHQNDKRVQQMYEDSKHPFI